METYSMRKIPFVQKIEAENFETDTSDKIKILELSNSIDEWEKELLFSPNGFYSLKGKEVENKSEEFCKELEKFITSGISKTRFNDDTSRIIMQEIKSKKMSAIQEQMQLYEYSQMKNWQREVFENAIKLCIQRAVLYKNNSEIVMTCHKSGLSVLEMMSETENWSSKTKTAKNANFESDFYYELINAFISEKDVRASIYFEKYKDKILKQNDENLAVAIKHLKDNIIAYNWAKELFSYSLEDAKNEKELKSIKDKEIQALARNYTAEFKQQKQKSEKKEKESRNEENWKEIINILSEEPDKAELHIDYTLDKESIGAKKTYIKSMRKSGYIQTDKNQFLLLLQMIFENFEKFKDESISNFRKCLSDEDYKLIENIRSYSAQEYNFFVSDYRFVQNQFNKLSVNDDDEIYDFVKFLFSVKENYVSTKKEEPDIEKRNKLIEAALERYTKK